MDDGALVLIEIGALLLGIALIGRLAGRLGITPIPLILLAGLAFGEGGLLPFRSGEEFIEVGAEIGVILLLLMLGLEYTADELVGNLRRSRRAGLLDMVLGAAPGALAALVLGWGPVSALALAGITWVSSSGVVAKMLQDLGRLANRETPVVLSILVIEDLAMAFYLPILTAVLIGLDPGAAILTVVLALAAVVLILYVALRHGHLVSKLVWSRNGEVLLLSVLGLTLVVSGLAAQASVSAAVGAFMVGIAISGPVAAHAHRLLTPLRDLFASVFFLFFGLSTHPADLVPMIVPAVVLAVITMAAKVLTGYLAARSAGIAEAGRWRAGFALTPRGEFSIVIAGLAVGAGVDRSLAALATAYVLITMVAGPLLARLPEAAWFAAWSGTVQARRASARRAAAS
ncbi:cation/H(+) antiporter [Microbacterium sp. B35-04]|uniref:cation:proton antiporter n=1 Tax=unclassified Microbacterium TaxID=2609290 RepID=UPI0013D3E800|nr:MULTISPECIES: cation:proton antiporter [unclassified Microbacterium]KAF2413602.1 cation/H(+) antiporter [Microbacterium sp. B35-04]KAF2420827.1 cation/H(+) antiporter [Microbacterium sp. B35-30]